MTFGFKLTPLHFGIDSFIFFKYNSSDSNQVFSCMLCLEEELQ